MHINASINRLGEAILLSSCQFTLKKIQCTSFRVGHVQRKKLKCHSFTTLFTQTCINYFRAPQNDSNLLQVPTLYLLFKNLYGGHCDIP